MATPNNAVPFFARLNAGMEETAEKYNITLKIQDANDDTNTQVNQVETFIQQGVDMIIMMPTQLESLIPAAKKVNDAGIPFMTVNRMLSAESAKDVGVDMITYVGADDYSGGQKKRVLIARSLCEQAHLYIWDEPLNYIDLFSRIQIEDLLLDFQPTLLFVEHDQMFRQKIATNTVRLRSDC